MAEITEFGPRKTIFILAIVAGCFAVLWPKIFYPMLTASVTPHHSTSDSSACCEVIFESDVTAVDIMQEMCQNILRHHPIDPRVRDALKLSKLTPQTSSLCREEVLARCGIDLSSFLAERERLGKSYKQVLEEIRSFNSSLCLKMNFGVPLSQLGTPHLIRYHILMPHSTIRQERRTPPHAGGMHPAMRERGRAIPSSHIVPRIVDRPDHVMPKMRPPLGGAGHVVPAPKGNGTMGIIMPLYTIGIVLFFLYTIVKVFKKNSDSEIISEYPGAAAEKEFRKMVFSPEALATAMTGGALHYQKERSPSLHTTTPTIEELKDLDGAPKFNGLAGVDRGSKEDIAQESHNREIEELDAIEQSPTIKVMGMEMTASCESGQKCSRPTTPIIPTPPSNIEREKTPPKPIYLEGALPPQCELLVTDSETQAEKSEDDDDAIVLSGKMTLSLISLDQIAAESEDETRETKEIEGTGDKRDGSSDNQEEVKNVHIEEEKIRRKEAEEIEAETEEEVEEMIEYMEDTRNNVETEKDKQFQVEQKKQEEETKARIEIDMKNNKKKIEEIKQEWQDEEGNEKKEKEEKQKKEETKMDVKKIQEEMKKQEEEEEEEEEEEDDDDEEELEEEIEIEEEEEEEEIEEEEEEEGEEIEEQEEEGEEAEEEEEEEEKEEEEEEEVEKNQAEKDKEYLEIKMDDHQKDKSDGNRYTENSNQDLEQSEDDGTGDEAEDDDMDADEEGEGEDEDEEHEESDIEETRIPYSEHLTRKRRN